MNFCHLLNILVNIWAASRFKNLLIVQTKSRADAIKTASKIVIQKTADEITSA